MPGQAYDRQLLRFEVTVTAGTAKATPQVNTWNIARNYLNNLAVRVPNGHVGLTGIVVLYGGVAIFPWGQPPGYLVTNAETVDQDFEQEEISAAFTIQTYNTDIFDHTFYLRADVNYSPSGGREVGSVRVVPVA